MKYCFRKKMLPFLKGSILVMLLLNINSCQLLSRAIWKVKKPQIETKLTTVKYLKKNKYDHSKVIYFKDLNAFSLFSKKYKMGIPEAYFINSSGKFVNYKKSTEECNAAVDDFIAEIEQINNIHVAESKLITDFNELLETPIPNQNEITVIMTWAIYAGKVNTTHSLDWINLVEIAQKKGVKINYYLLNCDILDTWGIDSKELKKSSKKE